MVAWDKQCTFDSVTEGATLTAANTASSGDAIATPNQTATGNAVANAAAAIRGGKGVTLTGVSGDVFAIILTQATAGSMSVQVYRRLSAASRPSSGATVIARIRNASTNVATIDIDSSGIIRVKSASPTGATIKTLHSSGALADGDYVFCLMATKGTTTSNGRIGCIVRDVATDTIQSDCNYDSGTTVNTGTADLTQAQTGIPSALSGNLTAVMDDMAVVNQFAEIDRASDPLAVDVYADTTIVPRGGTPPYVTTQDSGDTFAPIDLGNGIGVVERHEVDIRSYTVTDAALDTVTANIPALPTAAPEWPKVWNGSAYV